MNSHPIPLRLEIFVVALKLGCTSFGGPVAHLGYFHAEYVQRRRWLSEAAYADLVALCQFLPGPASSQLGFSIGLLRGGVPGGLLAWLGCCWRHSTNRFSPAQSTDRLILWWFSVPWACWYSGVVRRG